MALIHAEFERPLADMNTTPLIDVMLVLLIMFIMTIPLATNSIEVDLPGPAKIAVTPNAIHNKVAITPDDRILWNGQAVTQPQLSALLAATRKMPIEPELQFQPDGQASYDLSARVTEMIKRSGVTRFGFVGNENYAKF